MLNDEQLAYEIAKGIGQTGIEGNYGSVSCSTAGDYPSMGISQWEGIGGRGDALLGYIDGGQQFVGRAYRDIEVSGELNSLSDLLASSQGQEAQNQILAGDCAEYVQAVKEALSDDRCVIYAGMWCPTSHVVVRRFLINRADRVDLDNLEALRDIFRDEYYISAGVSEEYAVGYANRANNTYDYVAALGLA
jgi:hypothetical protein